MLSLGTWTGGTNYTKCLDDPKITQAIKDQLNNYISRYLGNLTPLKKSRNNSIIADKSDTG